MKSYYLSECGIQLIPFLRDEKDWDQLLYVLEHFAKTIPASEPLYLAERTRDGRFAKWLNSRAKQESFVTMMTENEAAASSWV